jgi:hypothetical protein
VRPTTGSTFSGGDWTALRLDSGDVKITDAPPPPRVYIVELTEDEMWKLASLSYEFEQTNPSSFYGNMPITFARRAEEERHPKVLSFAEIKASV